VLSIFRRVTGDELVEVARLAAAGGVLVNQREASFVELVEPLIPRNFFQRIAAAVTGEIETQDANIFSFAGGFHM